MFSNCLFCLFDVPSLSQHSVILSADWLTVIILCNIIINYHHNNDKTLGWIYVYKNTHLAHSINSICISLYLSKYLLPTYLPIQLFYCPSFQLITYLLIHLLTYLLGHHATYLPVYVPIYKATYILTYLLITLTFYLPISLYTYLSVHRSTYLVTYYLPT